MMITVDETVEALEATLSEWHDWMIPANEATALFRAWTHINAQPYRHAVTRHEMAVHLARWGDGSPRAPQNSSPSGSGREEAWKGTAGAAPSGPNLTLNPSDSQ
jgi:hypothetical protein